MQHLIGIMGEHKEGEFRVPLTPEQMESIQTNHPDIRFRVQPSQQRIYRDEEFRLRGIEVAADLAECDLVLAVKEIDKRDLHPRGHYLFFSHTIKGQDYNMPMLRHILDAGISLMDYELIRDAQGRRLVFFGRHAGLAGMIDTLWTLGRQMEMRGTHNPFLKIQQALHYADLEAARAEIAAVGHELPAFMEGRPALVFGISGYGNVSGGAQEILDLLPLEEISPRELMSVDLNRFQGKILKVVFKESDMVKPHDPRQTFDLQEYYDHPEHYESTFSRYLPRLDVLVNCIYWDTPYPRLITRESIRLHYRESGRLKVIGDITCDIEGAIECTLKSTTSADPVFTYLPESDSLQMGLHTGGPVILAVDNLPTELPRESSADFGKALVPFLPMLARCDYSRKFEELELGPEMRGAVICHRGKLTPAHADLAAAIQGVEG